jgi:hypothetical protein
MKRVLGSSLAALATVFCLTASALAAEIPATPACEVTYRALLKQAADESPRNPTDKQAFLAEKKLAEGLAAADCVSAARPLYRNLPTEPFTEQCYSAAAEAQAFVGPMTARLKPHEQRWNREVLRPYIGLLVRLISRKYRFEEQNRPRQAARVERKLKKLNRAYSIRVRKAFEMTKHIWIDDLYRIHLATLELRAQRCIPDGFSNGIEKDPGQRFVRRNLSLLFNAELTIWIRRARAIYSPASTSSMFELPGGPNRPRLPGGLPFFVPG